MSELVAIGFDDIGKADQALTELVRLQKEHLIDLEDAVVAIRGPDGAVRIKQSVNLVGLGAAQDGSRRGRRPPVNRPPARRAAHPAAEVARSVAWSVCDCGANNGHRVVEAIYAVTSAI